MSTAEYRKRCINRKGNRCLRCEGGSYDIVVHHIDGNRENNDIDNLAPLCGSCHQICHKNDYWDDFEAFLNSYPDSRVVADSGGIDEGRALLTDREREIIRGDADVTDNYEYKVKSTVRTRVRNRLGDDVAFLEEHFPEVYDLVCETVCEEYDGE